MIKNSVMFDNLIDKLYKKEIPFINMKVDKYKDKEIDELWVVRIWENYYPGINCMVLEHDLTSNEILTAIHPNSKSRFGMGKRKVQYNYNLTEHNYQPLDNETSGRVVPNKLIKDIKTDFLKLLGIEGADFDDFKVEMTSESENKFDDTRQIYTIQDVADLLRKADEEDLASRLINMSDNQKRIYMGKYGRVINNGLAKELEEDVENAYSSLVEKLEDICFNKDAIGYFAQ